jgi:hypothetical protein
MVGTGVLRGSNISNPHMDDAAAKNAYDAAQKPSALGCLRPSNEADRRHRHALYVAVEDRKALDVAYSDAMRGVEEVSEGQGRGGASRC